VLWARANCSGWKDVALLDFAESEARIVLTLDKDLWQLAVQRRIPIEYSGVVLFRVHPATPGNLGPLVRGFLGAKKQWAGSVSIVDADGIQMVARKS